MNRTKLRLIGAGLGALALSFAMPALADSPTTETTVTVDQSNFSPAPISVPTGSWGLTPDSEKPSGTAELVAGPLAAPLGAGSLRLNNTDAGQLTTVASTALAGAKLSDITGATYSTFVDEDSTPGSAQISLKISVPGTTLVFEPYFSDNAAASAYGAWHTWDAAAATTGWWETRLTTACKQATPCSFAAMKAAIDPTNSVTINDVRLAIGSGLANFDGNVDALALTVAGALTRYDFESNAVSDDVVTKVDDKNANGWSAEGSPGTSPAPAGSFDVHYAAGPNLPGLSGAGSASLNHSGPASYSAIVQDYAEGRADVTQTYLGSLDNIEAHTYRLASSTKGDYPSVRFEVRIPDPQTQFAFTSIVNGTGPTTSGQINAASDIHGAASTQDKRDWYITHDAAGLTTNTAYTWAEVMHSSLKDAVITKLLVAAGTGTGTGEFHGGVDVLRFNYRDGSSQTWDFEKDGVIPAPAAPTSLTAAAGGTSKVTVHWTDNATDESGFVLDRSTSPAFDAGLKSRSIAANSTAYTETGLVGSTTYYYRVKAMNSGGASAYSNVASATTAAYPPPPPPADTTPPSVTITTANDSIFLPGAENLISGTAFDKADGVSTGVTRVSVQITNALGQKTSQWACDGDCANTAGTPLSWSITLDEALLPGPYTVQAYASDALGHWGVSNAITVIRTI